ncbi:MAG: hypothetical protein K2M44_01405 [Clostridia bacterium]|nr:hypothetical protein [Clostridia bacterium]
MQAYNVFTWLIDFPAKPIIYKFWIYLSAPIIFIMWLCVQFVFKDLLTDWLACVFIPIVCIDIVWDCVNYIRFVMCSRTPKRFRQSS